MDINETLKLKEIDQLHAATLQFSKNTLATKKIWATLLVGVVTIILSITNNSLDPSIYVGVILTTLIFWFVDSYSYYYQRKLRIRMTEIVKELRQGGIIAAGYGMPLNEATVSWKDAFFDASQAFYITAIIIMVVVAIIDLVGWV